MGGGGGWVSCWSGGGGVVGWVGALRGAVGPSKIIHHPPDLSAFNPRSNTCANRSVTGPCCCTPPDSSLPQHGSCACFSPEYCATSPMLAVSNTRYTVSPILYLLTAPVLFKLRCTAPQTPGFLSFDLPLWYPVPHTPCLATRFATRLKFKKVFSPVEY